MLQEFGHRICDTILDFCDPDQVKVRQVLEDLEIMVPNDGNSDSESDEGSDEDSDGSDDNDKDGKKKKKGKPKKKNKK